MDNPFPFEKTAAAAEVDVHETETCSQDIANFGQENDHDRHTEDCVNTQDDLAPVALGENVAITCRKKVTQIRQIGSKF